MNLTVNKLLMEMQAKKNPSKAQILSGFFKTSKGHYGEGDVFLGLTVPEQRELAKKYKHLDLESVQKLLNSKIHEHRLTGLIILTYKYKEAEKKKEELKNKETKKEDKEQKIIFDFYLNNTKNINNWDLVDVTCSKIVGAYLKDKNRRILYDFAKSKNLWERRISIVSTYAFIKNDDFSDTLKISEILLKDKHDLIHKAVGWMLREAGKRDEKTLKSFLDKHHEAMPRTMLRYSLEKLNHKDKKNYMKK